MFSVHIAVAKFLIDKVKLSWDALVAALKGKEIAVLGARGVGKTHLIKFLTTGTIPTEYKQTTGPEKSAGRRLQLKDLDMHIKAIEDLSGNDLVYDQWKDRHDKADVVLYLFRADLIIAGDKAFEERVRKDIRHISDWRKASKKKHEPLFLVGTHCDKDPEYSKITPETLGDYIDRVQKLPIITELIARVGGTRNVKITLGSMKTIEETEVVVYDIFEQVLS